MLDHLVAAYRQYHTASGGYFAPHASRRRSYAACSRRAGDGYPYVALVGHMICAGQHICSA